MLRAVNIMLSICLLMIASNVHAASVTYGQTIDVDGSLRLTSPGNAIVFPDGTTLSSATVSTPAITWGGITGDITHQTDLQTALSKKVSLDDTGKIPVSELPILNRFSFTKSTAGYTPTWQNQGNVWLDLLAPLDDPPILLWLSKSYDSTVLKLTYTDNVGVYGSAWCNLGIFIDSNVNPSCTGSFSGPSYSTTFAQQTISCTVHAIPAGFHTFNVKHRSQNCMYGNYAWDEFSTMRKLTVEELL